MIVVLWGCVGLVFLEGIAVTVIGAAVAYGWACRQLAERRIGREAKLAVEGAEWILRDHARKASDDQ